MERPQASVQTISMTLGLFALGIAWRNAGHLFGLPAAIGEAICGGTFILWLCLVGNYFRQIWHSSNGVRREIALQLQNPFLALLPITTGLMSVAISPYVPDVIAHAFLFFSVVVQLLFSSYHIGGEWHGNTPMTRETPAMYMPTVGANFASTIALGAQGFAHWGYLFFGAGFLSWMSLEAVFLFHLRNNSPMPAAIRPQLGIQLAPAFVASSAYLSCNGGQIDAIVLGMLGYGLLNFFFTVRLLTWILRAGLSLSLWAFSFAMASMTNVGFRLWHGVDDVSLQILGQCFVICGTGVITLLLLLTIYLQIGKLRQNFGKE